MTVRADGLAIKCLFRLAACALISTAADLALAQTGAPQGAAKAPSAPAPFELVDPKVLRVCSDPHNLPFSDMSGGGFENKIAEMLARELGKSIAYTWYPSAPGFVRQTLHVYKCDIIMGMPQGDDIAQVTNPYYRTAYALVFKKDHGLDGVDSLTDPRLKEKRVGVVAGTPPATNMVLDGLIANAAPYPLVVDTRYDSSAVAMLRDIDDGSIDAGVLWGPLAGYYAKQATTPIAVVPLLKERNGSRMTYRIGMAVRYSDQEWKRQLNRLIREKQKEINALLLSYNVPLLDESDHALGPGASGD